MKVIEKKHFFVFLDYRYFMALSVEPVLSRFKNFNYELNCSLISNKITKKKIIFI